MRTLRRAFWFIAFLAATFCWMVVFQHGFSPATFQTGAAQEWARLAQLIGLSH